MYEPEEEEREIARHLFQFLGVLMSESTALSRRWIHIERPAPKDSAKVPAAVLTRLRCAAAELPDEGADSRVVGTLAVMQTSIIIGRSR